MNIEITARHFDLTPDLREHVEKEVSGLTRYFENINSRIWRRDFENGAAIVNPTENPSLVGGLGYEVYSKINGIQDSAHNSGE